MFQILEIVWIRDFYNETERCMVYSLFDADDYFMNNDKC